MNLHRLAALALSLLLLAGCKSGGNAELLERDLRLQEDQIYQLHDALDQVEAELESAQRENASLKKELAGGDRGAASDSTSAPVLELPSPSRTPRRGANDRPSAPLVEPGVQVDPGEEFDPQLTPAEGASHATVTDHRVHRIVLNKQLTGASGRGRGGDRGVLVVFEPRNRAGQLVNVPGEVSIAVLDLSQPGGATRVARWDFRADEAQQQFQKTALGRGYHFDLPWPSQPPTSNKLQLYVRYITPDGRKLTADMPISVNPPLDREARGWRSVPPTSRRSAEGILPAAPRSTVAAQAQTLAPTYTPPRRVGRVRASVEPETEQAAPAAVAQKAAEAPAEPIAKFLDPPQIVAENAPEELASSTEPRAADPEPAPRPRRKKVEQTARPVWTPYR